MRPKHRGSWGELLACAWLMEEGYEVYRNVSDKGPADIVIWNLATKSFIPVDVKTTTSHEKNTETAPHLEEFGIRTVYVNQITHKCWSPEPLEPSENAKFQEHKQELKREANQRFREKQRQRALDLKERPRTKDMTIAVPIKTKPTPWEESDYWKKWSNPATAIPEMPCLPHDKPKINSDN